MGTVSDRTVFTYLVNDLPAGVITGVPDLLGGLVIEHVIAFKQRAFLPMLRAGIQEAFLLGYHYLLVGIPRTFLPAAKLVKAAERVGFEEYVHDPTTHYLVRYLP